MRLWHPVVLGRRRKLYGWEKRWNYNGRYPNRQIIMVYLKTYRIVMTLIKKDLRKGKIGYFGNQKIPPDFYHFCSLTLSVTARWRHGMDERGYSDLGCGSPSTQDRSPVWVLCWRLIQYCQRPILGLSLLTVYHYKRWS
jgi:hypothetical protein